MGLSVRSAIAKLEARRTRLVGELSRIEESYRAESSRVSTQLASIDTVLLGLRNETNVAVVDGLLSSLEKAGLRIDATDL